MYPRQENESETIHPQMTQITQMKPEKEEPLSPIHLNPPRNLRMSLCRLFSVRFHRGIGGALSHAPRVFFVAVLFSSFLAPQASAPAAKPLAARVVPGVYHLGSKIPLELQLPLDTPAYFLEGDLTEGADWGPDARIASVKQVPPNSFPGPLALGVEVQVFTTGAVTLHPLPLTLRTGGKPQAFSIVVPPFTVAPLLPPGPQPEPPAAAPLPLPRSLPWGWVLLVMAAALGVAGWVWHRLRRPRLDAVPPPAAGLRETDPDRWIVEEVNRLFLSPLEPKARYTALSARLRDYLELKTGLPFLEWTTSEVQRGLARMGHLPPGSATDLMGVLALCDWAAFARYLPAPAEETDARTRALRFLAFASAPPPPREGAA